jgi:hypothetical protein
MKLKHVDLAGGKVHQDAREVNTKFSKSFVTYFFPAANGILEILSDWVNYLRHVKLWGNEDECRGERKLLPTPSLHLVLTAAGHRRVLQARRWAEGDHRH